MKRCFKCEKWLPRSAFYRHKSMADGLLGKCKVCARADARAHRSINIIDIRAKDRARGFRGKPTHAADYKAKHPERRAAQVALNNAIRDGRVAPWPVCALPECSDEPEAHHTDYSDPLTVVWICPAHHKQAHALARAST